MKFLLDTNILIPAEPTSPVHAEPTTPLVAQLLGLIAEAQSQPFVHPASIDELQEDQDHARRQLRQHLLEKYVRLPSPPPITQSITNVLGVPAPGSNTETDTKLLAAVAGNAVGFLVTSDEQMHRRAARIGLADRVLTPEDAIATIRALLPKRPITLPAVRFILCHELNALDPIFLSLQDDYPGFNNWLARCQREHRKAFLAEYEQRYGGIAILKQEESGEHGLHGKVLKICTFKVADYARGYRYGELLLKSIFEYVVACRFEKAYVTCFPRQYELIRFLETFGFSEHEHDEGEELVFVKRFDPTQEEREQVPPLDFHVKFGPQHISLAGADVYVVPIQPQFHKALFPDIESQRTFFDGETAFGNAILKAYLCNSSVRNIPPGSLLLFYRSQDCSSIRSVGVADACLRSTDAFEIARFVGKRTVFTLDHIQKMCQGETLSILFRQSRTISSVRLDELIKHNVLRGAPQQITKIKTEGMKWLRQLLEV